MIPSPCPARDDDPRRPCAVVQTRAARDAVIWISGEHDATTAPELTETLDRAIAMGRRDVVIDLRDVQFMDASTIGVMVRADACLRSQARALLLRAPSDCVRRVLGLSGLDGDDLDVSSCATDRSTVRR